MVLAPVVIVVAIGLDSMGVNASDDCVWLLSKSAAASAKRLFCIMIMIDE